MKKIIFTSLIALIALSFKTKAQTWQNVGNAGFTTGYVVEIPLTIISSVPYVAYSDGSSSFKATVMKYENSSWSVVGNQGFTSNGVNSIDFKNNGTDLYVAYTDLLQNAGVMRFDGTNWVNVGSGMANAQGQICLAFVNSTPFVAFIDAFNKPVVMEFDGTNWVSTGLVYSGNPSSNVIALATDGADIFVAYREASNSLLSVSKYNGTNWTNVGVASFSANTVSNIGPRPISLALNGTTPYVAYTSNDVSTAQISVMKFDGTNWTFIGPSIATSGQAYSPFLAFNNSTPYLAFQDFSLSPKKVRFLEFDGNNWINVVSSGISQGQAQQPSIAFDNNIPFVAFRDDANSSKGTVLKLANTTTSVNDFEQSPYEIQIYPNPTRNHIIFSVLTNAQLTNVKGQIIADIKNVHTLDLSDQPTGIYFLTLTDNNGQVLQRSKIVKE